MTMRDGAVFIAGLLLVLVPYFITGSLFVSAQSVDQLQDQIEEKNDKLKEIEAEIAKYQTALRQTGAEKATLQSAIDKLELERKKVQADIAQTQNRIGATDLEISKLNIEINDTTKQIGQNKAAIMEILRQLDEKDKEPLIELLLQYDNLSEFWNGIAELEQVRDRLHAQVNNLAEQNNILTDKRLTNEQKRQELVKLKNQYAGQHQVLEVNRAEKDDLLEKTQRKENIYQQLLTEQEAARAQVESDLAELEDKLQYTLDPSKLPGKGSGALRFPVANPLLTQGFGLTPFALSGAYGYDANGSPKPHRGVDFQATTGTQLLAAAAGTIRESYNMDAVPGCHSYGQWVLIDHVNGLSTLYAHLSSRLVKAGDSVSAGDVIGYSGSTGYATAAHLHFSVFPKDAVQVQKFSTSIGCKNALVPIAAPNAYLNPLDYLPSI